MTALHHEKSPTRRHDRLNLPGNLASFIAAARAAAAADNWFAALALALTLPDICGALENPGPGKSKARFVDWWDRYMAHHYAVYPDAGESWQPFTYLPGTEAFALRCSYLHAGTDDVARPDTALTRVRFLGPPSAAAFGFNPQTRTLAIGLEQFVDWVCGAVETWLAERAEDPEVHSRLSGLVSIIPSAIREPGRPTQP